MRSPALDLMQPLIGTWELTMTNAWFLDSLDEEVPGRASFEWLDDTLVLFRWSVGETPPTVCVIGYNTPREQYAMIYHDDRGIGRVFEMELTEDRWLLSREDPDFHQRFQSTLHDDRIVGAWEASEDNGQTWRKDFDLIFHSLTNESGG